jgi:glycosyltransferase involved in cell wall biosynthesis
MRDARLRPVEPVVAICMATFEPQPSLLEKQVASIQAQTHSRFICAVSDDASNRRSFAHVERVCAADRRFTPSRSARRLGYYRNFERALRLVPEEAEYVAFCDQDDVWHPDKLQTLLHALKAPDVLLAYSDMNIVSEDGELLAPSYWTDRRNNFTDLGSLLMVNTVTGAASLFRRELLDDALPFPPDTGRSYHDHWLACVALALGRIAFVDRPLHDYVQHGANVVGRHEPLPDEFKGGLVNALRRFATGPRRRLRNSVEHAPRYYREEVVRIQTVARALEERLGDRIRPEVQGIVHELAHLSSSPRAVLGLLGRSARDVHGESETLGIENQLIKGILWHWQDEARRRLRR